MPSSVESEWVSSPATPEKQEMGFEGEQALSGEQTERKGSTLGAYLNLVCVVVGTGSLSLPRTFAQSGWISILLVIVCGLMGAFTGVLIIKCVNHMEPGRERSFNQIGQAAFMTVGRVVIFVLQAIFV
ncbi:hypothetical protein H4S02_005836, partial [Coemansia sp. RSA 2611]